MREWKTLKEYDEILFEQHGKVAKITMPLHRKRCLK